MSNSILRIRFGVFFTALLCTLASIHAQNPKLAYAYPMSPPTIDGSLEEWSADLPKYMIDNLRESQNTHSEDFAGSFMVGYNTVDEALYVGIEVIDSDFVGNDGKRSHNLQDHALFYFDENHVPEGSAPVFWEVAQEHLKIHQKPAAWEAGNAHFSLENAQVKMQRKGNRIVYEWRLTLQNPPMSGKVYALDHFLIDQDRDQENQSILLWKNVFGKSLGSHRMGEIVLVDAQAEMGWVEGQVTYADTSLQNTVSEVEIHNATNADSWLSVTVDSIGKFSAYLPVGKYVLTNRQKFTSPLYSIDFKQNTRQLMPVQTASFAITKGDTSNVEPLLIQAKTRPDWQQKKGLLFASKRLDKKALDEFVKTWKDYLQIPAVSVAVIQNNRVVYERTLGVRNNSTKTPVNAQSLFEAASITKSVFATMVLRLAERNIIDLDKPLYEYLAFPNIAKDERSKLITARTVLNHQTGLDNWPWGGPGSWENGREIQLDHEPNTQFSYSGAAFNYLGRVVEHITQQSLTELFAAEIAQPFGLTNTHFYYSEAIESQVVAGHYHQFINYEGREFLASPASSLLTNAHDFSKFILGMMQEKNLKPESFQKIYTPYTVLKPEQILYDPHILQSISYGFFVQETPNGKLIAHGGNNGDFDAKFAYNPDKKVGYAVFTNSNLGDEFCRALELFLLWGKE